MSNDRTNNLRVTLVTAQLKKRRSKVDEGRSKTLAKSSLNTSPLGNKDDNCWNNNICSSRRFKLSLRLGYPTQKVGSIDVSKWCNFFRDQTLSITQASQF